jgi:hypothetical protein
MPTRSDSGGAAWVASASSTARDPGRAAEVAVINGTATLTQYARVAQPWIVEARRLCLPEIIAAEARERAGLLPRWPDDWQTVMLNRIAVYPLGCPVPDDVTRILEEAVDMALTVPPPPGLLPDQARVRSDCAFTLLLLGDETGHRLRRRVWSYQTGAWRFASDLATASRLTGLPAAAAYGFMGVPVGYFQERIDDGRVELLNIWAGPGGARSTRLVSYFDMARILRPPEEVCDGQIWSR